MKIQNRIREIEGVEIIRAREEKIYFSESLNNGKNRCSDKEIYEKLKKEMIKSIERTNFKQVIDFLGNISSERDRIGNHLLHIYCTFVHNNLISQTK